MNKKHFLLLFAAQITCAMSMLSPAATQADAFPVPVVEPTAPDGASPFPAPTVAPAVNPETLSPIGMTAATEQSSAPQAEQPTAAADVVNAAAVQEPEKKEIYLNFENTELASFVEYIAELKKLNIVYEKPIEGSKISLSIRDPLTITGAWNVFLTVLDMSGFALIEAGPISKIISKDKKINQPLPAYINVPWSKLPEDDSTIRYVTFLSNIQVGDIRPILEGMLSTPSAVVDEKNMNAFIITDKSNNIRAAAKLISELDQMGLPESVTVLKLKRVNATDAKELLDSLIRKPEGNPLARLLGKVTEGSTEYFSPTTKVIAEERSNSLILLGNSKSIDKIVDFITNHFDTELRSADSPLHVYELQHINAKQVAELLKEVTTPPESATGQAAGKFGATRGGVKYFRPMKFQVDKDGNRLIVSCVDKNDWELLKKTLDDLDKPQPQVALETMIVTINVEDNKKLGGQIRNKKHGQIGTNIDFQSASLTGKPTAQFDPPEGGDNATAVSLLGNLLSQLGPEQGQTAVTIGKAKDMWAVFRALKSQTNTSIIAQPFITITNKTEGSIEVGEERRVVSESQGETKGFVSLPASTSVRITPQINLDGMITMDIKVNISDFLENSEGNTATKSLETNVTIGDGQVLVLGGFVKTKVTENKAETPILGKIPVLGWFFKNQNRSISKDYIFLFISPTIIKPRQQPGMQLYTKMKLHDATEDIENSVQTKRTPDPIHNWFFNSEKENYSHKVIDFANARYQPTTVDIKNDLYYRSYTDEVESARIGIDEAATASTGQVNNTPQKAAAEPVVEVVESQPLMTPAESEPIVTAPLPEAVVNQLVGTPASAAQQMPTPVLQEPLVNVMPTIIPEQLDQPPTAIPEQLSAPQAKNESIDELKNFNPANRNSLREFLAMNKRNNSDAHQRKQALAKKVLA